MIENQDISILNNIIDGDIKNIKISVDDEYVERDFLFDMFGQRIYEGDYVIGPVLSWITSDPDITKVKPHLYIGKVISISEDSLGNASIFVEFYYKGIRNKGKSTEKTSTEPIEKQGSDLIKINVVNKNEHKIDL